MSPAALAAGLRAITDICEAMLPLLEPPAAAVRCGDTTLSPSRRSVAIAGSPPVPLTAAQGRLVEALLRSAPAPCTSPGLRAVLGYGPGSRTRALSSAVRRLRQRLWPHGSRIAASPGGYAWRQPQA